MLLAYTNDNDSDNGTVYLSIGTGRTADNVQNKCQAGSSPSSKGELNTSNGIRYVSGRFRACILAPDCLTSAQPLITPSGQQWGLFLPPEQSIFSGAQRLLDCDCSVGLDQPPLRCSNSLIRLPHI
ncbi:unnamed protein product [Leuciscus chuanchicus]